MKRLDLSSFAAIACVAVIGLLPHNPDHWRHQTFFGLLVIACLVIVRVRKELDEHVAGILMLIMMASVFHVFKPELKYMNFGFQAAQKLQGIQATSFAYFLMIVGFGVAFPKNWHPNISRVLAWLCIGNSLALIGTTLFWTRGIGILNNSSFDGTLNALLIPFLMDFVNKKTAKGAKHWRLAVLAPLIGAFASLSSTAVVVTGAVMAIQNKFLRLAAPVLLISCWLGWSNDFWSSQLRVEIWELAMKYWREAIDPVVGAGPGTYLVFGPHVQLVNQFKTNTLFLFMHNDWLQVTFEYGLFGLACSLALFVRLFQKSKTQPINRTLLIAYSLACLTQPMLRLLPTAMLGAIICRKILDDE